MYRVLIVDDDLNVRKMLTQTIDWNSLGYDSVLEAFNGIEALDILKDTKVDLLLLDISMPQMDGLEVIRQLKQRNYLVEIIILSCHDEFDYVKEAMRLGASDYMLKHLLSVKGLKEEIIKANDRIEKSNLAQNQHYHNQRKKSEEERAMKNELLLGIMKNGTSAEFVDKKIQYYYKELQTGNYGLILLYLEKYQEVIESFEPDGKYILYMIMNNIVKEICEEYGERALVEGDNGRYILLVELTTVSESETMKTMLQISHLLDNAFQKYIDLKFSFVYSQDRISYQQLSPCYHQLINKSNHLFYEGISIINERQYAPFEDKRMTLEVLNKRRLKLLGVKGDGNSFVEAFLNSCYSMMEDKVLPEAIRNLTKKLFLLVLDEIKNKRSIEMEPDSYEHILRLFTESFSVKKYTYAVDMAAEFIEKALVHDNETEVENIYVKKSIQYIKAHYKEDISLNEVAESIHVNPTYLSNLFKNCININYVDYVKDVRVKKACEMLQNSSLPIKDIGTAVGIPNRKYFSKIFKHTVGVSPQEYKKQKL